MTTPSTSRRWRLVIPVATVVMCFTSLMGTGCLVTNECHTVCSGNGVDPNLFRGITTGMAADAVRRTLGPPTSITRSGADTQFWKYTYAKRQDKSVTVFLLFNGEADTDYTHTAVVEIRNGKVADGFSGDAVADAAGGKGRGAPDVSSVPPTPGAATTGPATR